jgi:hypothetical protein
MRRANGATSSCETAVRSDGAFDRYGFGGARAESIDFEQAS